MSKYTPGPWHVRPSTMLNRLEIEPVIGCAYGAGEEIKANACLIAAAPELLVALKDCRSGLVYIRERHGELYGVGFDRAINAADAAIAKAEGKS